MSGEDRYFIEDTVRKVLMIVGTAAIIPCAFNVALGIFGLVIITATLVWGVRAENRARARREKAES